MKPLQHKKHTLAKRGLSLLCVLALCLSLLPVTALAAEGAPNSLYVGNQQFIIGNDITYWTTDANTGKLTAYTTGGDDWNVKYDPSSNTLTLRGASIQGGSDTVSEPYGSGIYALSRSGQPVSLTIKLIGENTITGFYGIFLNAEINASSYGTNATLTIIGESNGRLKVSGSYHGIYVKSGTGNASLNIKNVAVTSSTNGNYAAGVFVSSSTEANVSPNLSLAVNGGSLTASGGESSDGIWFYVGSSQASNATTSLTVSENAIVDAKTGGIKASDPNLNNLSDRIVVGSGTGTNGGIVFDGSAGTVYGDVTLQEDLEIGDGETLTIGKDASLTVSSGTTLTNNGTVTTTDGGSLTNQGTINNSGTLPDSIEGSQPPKITTASLPNGEVDTTYNQTLGATGSETITWSLASGSTMPAGLTLNSDGTITGTPTTAGQFTFTATATNSAGSDSKEYELTINAPQNIPVNGVTLNPTLLSLFTGGSETLTATVEPSNATNKNVTWSSDNADVATVDNGTVTAVGAGKTTISVTTEDGGKTATCTVTVTDKTYAISADATALNFGSAYTGYAQPAAQTVTVENTGNQPVTLNQPSSTDNFVVGNLTDTELVAGETATFKVQPKAGLAAGTYSDTITVSDTNNNVTSSITASFTVKSRPSYNPPTVSEETIDAIQDAQPGETVTVDLSSGSTKLDKEVFETLAGKDVTLVVDLGDGVSWIVKGSDVPEDADFTDIDMGVTMNSDGIPVEVVNAITGERDSVQLTLAHDGAFGFTMTLTAPLGSDNAGYWANLYHFDEDTNKMTFETAAQIGDDGSVSLPLSHASQYAIVIDDHNHGVVTLPFIDVHPGDWFYDPVCFVYENGLMTGTSATTFEPNTHLTRAMLVAMLHRLEGSPQASGGVVNGFDDGSFQPNTAITREQLAAILCNYAQYKGFDTSTSGDLSTFTDAASVSDWAQESVEWMVGSGLLGGYEDSTLRPQGTTTRAEVASVLQRALGNVAGNQ